MSMLDHLGWRMAKGALGVALTRTIGEAERKKEKSDFLSMAFARACRS